MGNELEDLKRWLAANREHWTEIEQRSGVSQHTFLKILNGQTKDPRWSTVHPLLEVKRRGVSMTESHVAG